MIHIRSHESHGQVLGLLMDRLGNEMTRMATLKALASVSVSPLKVDLTPILPSATEELALFLRQQSRPLKQTTLETLLALIGRCVYPAVGSLFRSYVQVRVWLSGCFGWGFSRAIDVDVDLMNLLKESLDVW